MNKKPKLPPRRAMTSIVVQSLNNDRKRIYKAYRILGTWRAVGEKFGVPAWAAFRFAVEGKEPRRALYRARLGLPATALAPVCARCGIVHVAKSCPAERAAKPKKPRTNWRRFGWWMAGMVIYLNAHD